MAANPIFSWKKLATFFLVITVCVSASSSQKLATFFLLITLVLLGDRSFFGMQKFAAPIVGPFLWGPCSAEHAEHA